MRRTLALTAMTASLLMGLVVPASAHVEVTPDVAAPGKLQMYTVTVPNERDDQATVEVEVTLPAGFTLDVAQSVPGWTTVITKKGGAPVAVAWKAGRIPVGTFSSFQLLGRNPARTGALSWRALQRYERTTVTWDGPSTSENPAAVVRLVPGAATSLDAVATPASGSTQTSRGSVTDPLARSRAALGVALGIAALAALLAPISLRELRRRAGSRPPAPPAAKGQPASSTPPQSNRSARPREGGVNAARRARRGG
jgi:uncharacterized protein YcnI